METRIAVVSIIVENMDSAGEINDILHSYGRYIIGRMGIPYNKRDVSIISVVMEAPPDVISALSGKLGMLSDVTSKTVLSKKYNNSSNE
ncbi:MAG TPA: iron-only hydrogenase system regulator [Clostridiales bacterium]|nr:iron-only hydrogenase system regulator [Clostridiales bacterium]